MSKQVKALEPKKQRSVSNFRGAIIVSSWNRDVTSRLKLGAIRALEYLGLDTEDQVFIDVPGCVEIAIIIKHLLENQSLDFLVALGAVIKGDTEHDYWVSKIAVDGISRLSIDKGVPIGFGILTTPNLELALERACDDETNKGFEALISAVEVAEIIVKIREKAL